MATAERMADFVGGGASTKRSPNADATAAAAADRTRVDARAEQPVHDVVRVSNEVGNGVSEGAHLVAALGDV